MKTHYGVVHDCSPELTREGIYESGVYTGKWHIDTDDGSPINMTGIDRFDIEEDLEANLLRWFGLGVDVQLFSREGHAFTDPIPSSGTFVATVRYGRRIP